MMEKLFTSRTRAKLLTLFLTQLKKEFYVRELQRKIKENVTSVRRELENLKELGLVNERKEGIQKFYSLNKNHPIYEELRRIVLKTEGVGKVLKDKLSKLAGIKYSMIYGSFAKGTEIESSDVDLIIIGTVDERKLLKQIRKVEGEIGREVNYILWSEEEFKKKIKEKNSLLMNIVENPVIGVIGDIDEFRRIVKG
jgi:predicted nucleotidyltransferase